MQIERGLKNVFIQKKNSDKVPLYGAIFSRTYEQSKSQH